jgi:hypothetical protein
MLLSMAVMERSRWTDERIDERFDRVDTDIRALRTEVKEGFARIDKRFDTIDKRFERVDDKFDAVQRNMLVCFVTLNASFIGGLIATHL